MSEKPIPPPDLWAQMDAVLMKLQGNAPGADWLTTEQVADRYKRSVRWAEIKMNTAAKAGLAVKETFVINGHRRALYKLVQKPEIA